MSGIPPQLHAETGMPAGEWAAKTTSALRPSTPPTGMNPTTAQLFEQEHMSTTSTPGQEVPGAYPRKEEQMPQGQSIHSTAAKIAESVSNTASLYLPAAAQSAAQYFPQSVVDTVSSYIPGMKQDKDIVVASVHDHPHHISMPSSELAGASENERVEGCGSLPGSVDEFDVTELPEQRERTMVEEGLKPEVVQVRQRVSGFDAPETSLPSKEVSGAKPFEHSGGVGALPGKATEPAVAVLPGETIQGATLATSASVGTHGRTFDAPSLPSQDDAAARDSVSGGVGALPGKSTEAAVAVLPDERTGMGKWETSKGNAEAGTTHEEAVLHPGVQPTRGMTERKEGVGARDTGLGAMSTQDPQSMSAREGAVRGAAGAAAIGAAGGQKEMQKEESEPKKETHGEPNMTEHHPAESHPAATEHVEPEKAKEPVAERTGESRAAETGTEAESQSPSQQQKTKKAGFMAKMKGEALTLLGKVEGKKEKVEEGQRMKSGQTAATH